MEIPGYYFDPATNRYFKGKKPEPPKVEVNIDVNTSIMFLTNIETGDYTTDKTESWDWDSPLRPSISISHPSVVLLDCRGDDIIVACDSSSLVDRFTVGTKDISHHIIPTSLFGRSDTVSSIELNPVRSNVVGCSLFGGADGGGSGVVFDKTSGSSALTEYSRGSVWSFKWHPSGSSYAIGGTGRAYLVDVDHYKSVATGPGIWTQKNDVFCQDFDRMGNVLLNGCRDGTVRSTDLRGKPSDMTEMYRDGKKRHYSATRVKLMRDERTVLVGYKDTTVLLYDRRNGNKICQFGKENPLVESTVFTTDQEEDFLFVGGHAKVIQVYEIESGRHINTLGPFKRDIRVLQSAVHRKSEGLWFTPDERKLGFWNFFPSA
ncbi:hypothetical protein PROFUN_08308 [Planoprotostelium fungivorum]|uniref:Uncharacterized protein n=1 Tax=Planoprotostelium fungivorum TaxID=1890364 RepID=A0A2P6NJY9_9EUKA|nr:hypothetical protein PROFUN_08308 [Planoprotostelium fungivorum]